MDITNNERMRLAASAYRAYIQHAAQMELPLDEDAIEDDILADLIAGLHHYADSRGIDFDNAVASGQAAYERHRASEDNPYRIGDEVHLRQRPDTGFPSRGVVVSIFPERDGEPAYHVRFPGQADATPLRGLEIGPAASFPVVTTNQGTAASLAVAERLLIETAARIRACEQRQVPPHDHDLADKDSLLLAIGNACALAGSDVLRHLEPQVAAWTDVITQPWHPVHVTSATELAALDFPQPVQASVLADPQSADAGARQDAPHRPEAPSRGIRHRRPSDTPKGRPLMSEGTAALMTAGNASDPAITPYTQARDALTVADSPGSDPARVVVEAGCGILVYPPEEAGEPWRATFTENGRRRFRQAMTEAELAAKLAKVTERLRAGAPDMERPGADLIAHYLDPDRLPVSQAVVPAAR